MQLEVPWDPEVEATVSRLLDQAASAQVRVDSLHPYDRETFMENLRSQLLAFYHDIDRGYEVLLESLIALTTSGGSEGSWNKETLKSSFPQAKTLKNLSEDRLLQQWIDEGKPLYQVLGFSSEAMAAMYEAAYALLDQGRDDDARAAFRVLVVLAPHVADFWTGYGVTQIRLGEAREAVLSFEQAFAFDPLSIQILLLLCRALVEANRRGEAEARLSAKLDEAARRRDDETYAILEEARFELMRFAAKPV